VRAEVDAATLPAVPVVDLGAGSWPAPGSPFWTSAEALLGDLEQRAGRRRVALLDAISRRWLASCRSPYLAELDALAARLARPGTYLLNLSYEWAACSVSVQPDAAGGARMLRTLDWELDGIGRHAWALLRTGPAGSWAGLSWPLFVGEVTVFAPGRFALAFNMAPPRTWAIGGRRAPRAVEFVLNVLERAVSRRLPAAHLVRLVAERAENAREAVRMLAETPIARSAIFVVAGLDPSETRVIDRLPEAAEVRRATCATNHFARRDWPGVPLEDSFERLGAIALPSDAPFAWCRPPVRNERTRYAAEMNPRERHLDAVTMEAGGDVTRATRISVP
jgi:Acyl-coenzyme A:6-aminopenicillanic acid acyl-transferase